MDATPYSPYTPFSPPTSSEYLREGNSPNYRFLNKKYEKSAY